MVSWYNRLLPHFAVFFMLLPALLSPATPLALGGQNDDDRIIDMDFVHCLAVKADGTLWTWCDIARKSLDLPPVLSLKAKEQASGPTPRTLLMTGIGSIRTIDGATFVITDSGDLWGWGNNLYSTITINPYGSPRRFTIPWFVLDDVAEVSVGEAMTLALRKDGSLWAWGVDADHLKGILRREEKCGQPMVLLGEGVKGMSVSEAQGFLIDRNDRLFGWRGMDHMEDLKHALPLAIRNTITPMVSGVRQVFAGYGYSFAVTKKGALLAWGENLREITPDTIKFPDRNVLSDKSSKKILSGDVIATNVKDVSACWFSSNFAFRTPDDRLWLRAAFDGDSLPSYCVNKSKTHDGAFFVMEDVERYQLGYDAILVLKKDGSLWGCGDGTFENFGIYAQEPAKEFVRITLPPTPEDPQGAVILTRHTESERAGYVR
jgi:alpha-tubulin suppressor-like RCC1 family protein